MSCIFNNYTVEKFKQVLPILQEVLEACGYELIVEDGEIKYIND